MKISPPVAATGIDTPRIGALAPSGLGRYKGLAVLAFILAVLRFLLPNSFYFDVVIRIAINAIVVIALMLR